VSDEFIIKKAVTGIPWRPFKCQIYDDVTRSYPGFFPGIVVEIIVKVVESEKSSFSLVIDKFYFTMNVLKIIKPFFRCLNIKSMDEVYPSF